jgi:AcrR family transcriptional regulator
MTDVASDYPAIIDTLIRSTEQIFLNQGFDKTTLESIATHSGQPLEVVRDIYPDRLDALVAMLNTEFSAMYAGIANNVDRDPLGGFLSRIYTYVFCEVYERPVSRVLFTVDRYALRDLMSHRFGQIYAPSVEIRQELVDGLYVAGMLRPEVDTKIVSQAIGVISGGLAITSPHENLDELVSSVMMWSTQLDADVEDTSPGKEVFHRWVARLDNVRNGGDF